MVIPTADAAASLMLTMEGSMGRGAAGGKRGKCHIPDLRNGFLRKIRDIYVRLGRR